MTNNFRSTNPNFPTLVKLPFGWMRKLILLFSLALLGWFLLVNSVAVAQTDKRQAGVMELAAQSKPTSGKRVALLLANSKYVTSPLSNPKNDLALMEKTLRSLGFEVVGGISKGQDLKAAEMAQLLRGEFRSALRNADTAVVFYAGHGKAFDGETYLLDVNYAFIGKESVDYQSLALTNIYKEIENASVPHNFVFIDACRTLPGPTQNRGNNQRNIGLAQPKDPANTITLFSTGLGSAAKDGVGSANSPFTTVLARELAKPGQDWDDIEKAISREVKKDTKNEQQPKRYGGLDVKYYFNIQAPTTIVVQPAPTTASTASSVELVFWASAERLNTITAYQNYLNKYPKGEFAPMAQTSIEGLRAAQALATSVAAAQRPAVVTSIASQPIEIRHEELKLAMSKYFLDDEAKIKALSDLSQRGNIFASLMLSKLEVVNKIVVPVKLEIDHLKLAVREIERLSAEGDLIALSWQSNVYYSGLAGQKVDLPKAVRTIKLAASAGYPYAQYRYGYMLEIGKGVPKSELEALDWYRKGDAGGNISATYSLAHYLIDRKEDPDESFRLFQKAANAGSSDAILLKSLLTAMSQTSGSEIPADVLKTWREYADAGNFVVTLFLYQIGKEKTAQFTDSETFQRLQKIVSIINSSELLFELGANHFDGKGVNKNPLEAQKWYDKALKIGGNKTLFEFGKRYSKGIGVIKNQSKAMSLYNQAVQRGGAQELRMMGDIYKRGDGVEQDKTTAIAWYRKAVAAGDAEAMYSLSKMYEDGDGVAVNGLEAFNLLNKAALAGNVTAMNSLGLAYKSGNGVTQNQTLAAEWLRKSIDAGYVESSLTSLLSFDLRSVSLNFEGETH